MTDAKSVDPRVILLTAQAQELITGLHSDPFSILGPRRVRGVEYVVAHVPLAQRVFARNDDAESELAMHPDAPGVFVGKTVPWYRLAAVWPDGGTAEWEDPYRMSPVMGDVDEYLIGQGKHYKLWNVLGAHCMEHDDLDGVHFAVWAPDARRVSVVGDFDGWDARRHPMRLRGASGVWELFIPGLGEGVLYKYAIVSNDGDLQPLKADPVGFGAEHPPRTSSVVRKIGKHLWRDTSWMSKRESKQQVNAPVSIYEVHLASWRRTDGGRSLSYDELAAQLVDYVADLGYTHIECLPITEYPFDGSWGYQPIGMYAPTIRFGLPESFAALVDAAHNKGLGLILDWVPAHFPADAHGLVRFDGTALYEYADPREGFHRDWNTLIYNFGRREVANFLVANALYWMHEYHVDGIRVDAVASMLQRNYSRPAGQWIPNKYGGTDNLEAIELLKNLNIQAYARNPGVITIAEESTTFPGVSRPVDQGGLGFGYKWNIGWMNDVLTYLAKLPIHRKYHHDQITFGLTYAFSENFVLPISHDEVVHGKGSMYGKVPGTPAEKLATLRTFYAFMWAHPGKKLLFMGQEFAQPSEWAFASELEWNLLDNPGHKGIQTLIRDLNGLYRSESALYAKDTHPDGFRWLVVDDGNASVFAWARYGLDADAPVAFVANFTPIDRLGYKLPLPRKGRWEIILNTDSHYYGGGNHGTGEYVITTDDPAENEAQSALVDLPGLSAMYLKYLGPDTHFKPTPSNSQKGTHHGNKPDETIAPK